MSAINREFLFDSALAVGALLVMCRFIQIRIMREKYLNKYKRGSLQYENITKALRIRWPLISGAVAAVFTMKLVFDVKAILKADAPDKTYILTFVPVAILITYGLSFGIAYSILRKKQ